MKAWLTAITILFGASACTPGLVSKLPYYKLSVMQGVPFDASAILALRTGMTRQQVQMEIGSPLLNQTWRNNRWDYVYAIAKGGKIQEKHTLTIYFNHDVVSQIEGDALDYARSQINQGK